MSENGKTEVLATRARRAAASTGASVRRTGRGIRAKAYGKLVELHERLHAEAEAAAAEAEAEALGVGAAGAGGAADGAALSDSSHPAGPVDAVSGAGSGEVPETSD